MEGVFQREAGSAPGGEPIGEGLKEHWDRHAPDWDRKYRAEHERAEHEKRIDDTAAWLRAMGLLGADSSVADVGCGPGRFVAEFAKTAGYVVGLDISPKMAEYGARYCREAGLDNTRFYAADFAEADLEALGLAGKFDLAFSSITPAVSGEIGIEQLMRLSRAWCFNASFVYSDNPLHTELMNTLFHRDPRRHKTNHSEWFHTLFEFLWQRGYYPITHYYTQVKAPVRRADAETARQLTEYLLEDNEKNDEAVGKILKFLQSKADRNGFFTEYSECRYGWLLWDVRERHERKTKA